MFEKHDPPNEGVAPGLERALKTKTEAPRRPPSTPDQRLNVLNLVSGEMLVLKLKKRALPDRHQPATARRDRRRRAQPDAARVFNLRLCRRPKNVKRTSAVTG